MRLSFAKHPAPMLIGVVREKTVRDAIAAIRNCEIHGATGIDLHLSCLEEKFQTVSALKTIVDACTLPILTLNYSQTYDWEPIETDEETRVALLLRSIEAGAAALDMQGYTFDLPSKNGFRPEFESLGYSFTQNNPNEIVVDPVIIEKQMDLIERVHHAGAEVLLSTHPGIYMPHDHVVELALFLEQRKPDVIKIITACTNEDQLAESFRTMVTLKKELHTPVHFHCSGKAGRLSRIINPILGGYLCFCSDTYTASSNFEQLHLQTARTVLDNIDKLR